MGAAHSRMRLGSSIPIGTCAARWHLRRAGSTRARRSSSSTMTTTTSSTTPALFRLAVLSAACTSYPRSILGTGSVHRCWRSGAEDLNICRPIFQDSHILSKPSRKQSSQNGHSVGMSTQRPSSFPPSSCRPWLFRPLIACTAALCFDLCGSPCNRIGRSSAPSRVHPRATTLPPPVRADLFMARALTADALCFLL